MAEDVDIKRESIGYYATSRPTIWQRLGFGECSAPRPEEEEHLEGFAASWLMTDTRIRLDWKDRLRVLLSGNLMVSCATKTDHPVGKCFSRSAVSVMAPGAIKRAEEFASGSFHGYHLPDEEG
jgi:hypothetical protein